MCLIKPYVIKFLWKFYGFLTHPGLFFHLNSVPQYDWHMFIKVRLNLSNPSYLIVQCQTTELWKCHVKKMALRLFIFKYVLRCDVRSDIRIETTFDSSLPPVVCRRAHLLSTLFVFACVEWCPTHIVLCFCFVFLRLVYNMLPVSMDCPFLIALSIFSNVY